MSKVPELEDVPEVMQKIADASKVNNKSQQNHLNIPFAGMQKGFLGQDNQKPKKKTEDILPYIKSNPKSNLVLPEVQKALKEDFKVDDFHEELSSRLQANTDIANVLEDPLWLSILNEFQQDAKKAMKKYENNESVKNTMLKLCNVFGDSFLHMATGEKNDEERLVQKLMDSPMVKEAMLDPYISRMMDLMKANRNDQVVRMLTEANLSQKQKIQVLIDHGLFSFQS